MIILVLVLLHSIEKLSKKSRDHIPHDKFKVNTGIFSTTVKTFSQQKRSRSVFQMICCQRTSTASTSAMYTFPVRLNHNRSFFKGELSVVCVGFCHKSNFIMALRFLRREWVGRVGGWGRGPGGEGRRAVESYSVVYCYFKTTTNVFTIVGRKRTAQVTKSGDTNRMRWRNA